MASHRLKRNMLGRSSFILTMKLLPRRDKEKVAKTLKPVVGEERTNDRNGEERELRDDVSTI
jgi:hypothetical protein